MALYKAFQKLQGDLPPNTACCASKIHTNESLSIIKRRSKSVCHHSSTALTHHGHFQISCRYIQQHFPCWFVQISPVGLSNWCIGRWRTHSRPSTLVVNAFYQLHQTNNFLLTHMCCFLFSLHRTTRAMPHPCCCFFDTHTHNAHTPTDTASHHDS
jgi:hypothetical protein